MAIFKPYTKKDPETHRASEDVRRHRELVVDSIKKNIDKIISDESIIGQSKGKKIKIPMKGLKEYRFVYGNNSGKGVGSGDGDEKRGDTIQESDKEQGKGDGKAGNDEGEDIFETEITIDELIQYLLEDLELPDIDKKKMSDIISQVPKRLGYQKKGIPPRLAKRKTMEEHAKRKQGMKRALQDLGQEIPEDFRVPMHEDDLKYWRQRIKEEKQYNAVIICIMDVSGSMDQTKKYLARTFYFLLSQFIKSRYEQVEIVFLAHTTVAKEVNENEFFHKGESGGTYISSGYEMALEIIKERYDPSKWNVYSFHCTDGDEWIEDSNKAAELANKLCSVCNLFGYVEVIPGTYYPNDTFKKTIDSKVKAENLISVRITSKQDVVPALRHILLKESEKDTTID